MWLDTRFVRIVSEWGWVEDCALLHQDVNAEEHQDVMRELREYWVSPRERIEAQALADWQEVGGQFGVEAEADAGARRAVKALDGQGVAFQGWLHRNHEREWACGKKKQAVWQEAHAERFFRTDYPLETVEGEDLRTQHPLTEDYIGPTSSRVGLTADDTINFFSRLMMWISLMSNSSCFFGKFSREVFLPGRATVAEKIKIAFERNCRAESPKCSVGEAASIHDGEDETSCYVEEGWCPRRCGTDDISELRDLLGDEDGRTKDAAMDNESRHATAREMLDTVRMMEHESSTDGIEKDDASWGAARKIWQDENSEPGILDLNSGVSAEAERIAPLRSCENGMMQARLKGVALRARNATDFVGGGHERQKAKEASELTLAALQEVDGADRWVAVGQFLLAAKGTGLSMAALLAHQVRDEVEITDAGKSQAGASSGRGGNSQWFVDKQLPRIDAVLELRWEGGRMGRGARPGRATLLGPGADGTHHVLLRLAQSLRARMRHESLLLSYPCELHPQVIDVLTDSAELAEKMQWLDPRQIWSCDTPVVAWNLCSASGVEPLLEKGRGQLRARTAAEVKDLAGEQARELLARSGFGHCDAGPDDFFAARLRVRDALAVSACWLWYDGEKEGEDGADERIKEQHMPVAETATMGHQSFAAGAADEVVHTP